MLTSPIHPLASSRRPQLVTPCPERAGGAARTHARAPDAAGGASRPAPPAPRARPAVARSWVASAARHQCAGEID